jgi:hypothetical protein
MMMIMMIIIIIIIIIMSDIYGSIYTITANETSNNLITSFMYMLIQQHKGQLGTRI